MRTTFFGYELARRALSASQRGLDVTGHNIANAATPGYTRQRVSLLATDPYTVPSVVKAAQAGQVGTGVIVTQIQRLQSSFLEAQSRVIISDMEAWSRQGEALARLEALTNEPGESGLHTLLDRFWNSWQSLSTDPSAASLRQGCVQAASSLADGLNRTARQIVALQSNADEGIRADVHKINSLAKQLLDLNQSIRLAQGSGDRPNDLLDHRDVVLRDLASVANVTTREYGDGSIAVSIGGYDLVQQFGVNQLRVISEPSTGYAKAEWAESGVALNVKSGSLPGAIVMRDQIYQGFLNDLDHLTDAIVERVNALHSSGFDGQIPPQAGGDFFDAAVSGARGIRVSAAIAADIRLIAASLSGEAGDGQLAVALGRLKNEDLPALGGINVDDFYRGLIASVAVRGQEAERVLNTQELLSRQVATQQAQRSGVSLDEEMIELIKHQHVYNAAARLLSVMDEMVLTLIQRTGAGR